MLLSKTALSDPYVPIMRTGNTVLTTNLVSYRLLFWATDLSGEAKVLSLTGVNVLTNLLIASN